MWRVYLLAALIAGTTGAATAFITVKLTIPADPQPLAKGEKGAREADANPIPPGEVLAKKGPQEESVYIATKRPDKYHVKDCRTLSKNGWLEIKLADALKQNYEPCKICNPPIVAKDPKK